MTERQTTPELRFPEFKDNWKPIKLETLLQETNIKQNQNTPLFSLTVENGLIEKIDRYNREFLVKKADAFKNVKPLNIVYNPMNITLGAIDLLSINKEVKVSGYYNVLEIKDQTNPKFLIETLKTYKSILLYKKVATGSLKEKQRVHFSEFKKLHKLFPSYTEQNKIGNFFSKLDRQIELEEEKLELLEQQKKGYMQKIFSQEVRFKDEKGGTYPNWKNEALGSIVKITMGQSPSSKNYTENSSYTILVQGNADLNNGCIKPRIYTKQVTKLAEVNDILLTVRAPVGKIGRAQLKACIGRGVCAIKGDIFIYYFLELFDLQNKWIKFSQGSTFESISGNEIKSIDIAYPTNEERQKISKFLSKLDELLKNQLLKIELLKQRKQGLLQKMFV